MAVFFINNCVYDNCGKNFATLHDLINHIEDAHIDDNLQKGELNDGQYQQYLPLSYVLKYNNNGSINRVINEVNVDEKQSVNKFVISNSTNSSLSSNELEEETSYEREESSESLTDESVVSEYVLHYPKYQMYSNGPLKDKPFACPVPGCRKRYKNINGMKYHAKNGHKVTEKSKKDYICALCSKCYKTAMGLKTHLQMHNNNYDEHIRSVNINNTENVEELVNSNEYLVDYAKMQLQANYHYNDDVIYNVPKTVIPSALHKTYAKI